MIGCSMSKIFEIIDNWLERRFFVISSAERNFAKNLDSEIYKAATLARDSGREKGIDKEHDVAGPYGPMLRKKAFPEFYSKILYAGVLTNQKIMGLSLDDKKKIQESFNKNMIMQKNYNLQEAAEFYRKFILIIIGIVILVIVHFLSE